MKEFLDKNGYVYDYNKKCNLDSTCQTYYPDFLIDCVTFFIILECDENAHFSYPEDCERIRENNICFALGLPCIFLRYNPDKKGIKMKTKQIVLKSYIEYYKSLTICDNETVFLFLNAKELQDFFCTWLITKFYILIVKVSAFT